MRSCVLVGNWLFGLQSRLYRVPKSLCGVLELPLAARCSVVLLVPTMTQTSFLLHLAVWVLLIPEVLLLQISFALFLIHCRTGGQLANLSSETFADLPIALNVASEPHFCDQQNRPAFGIILASKFASNSVMWG